MPFTYSHGQPTNLVYWVPCLASRRLSMISIKWSSIKKGVDNASEKHLSIHRWESETLDRENTKGQSAFFIRLTQRKKPGCIGERRYSNTRR